MDKTGRFEDKIHVGRETLSVTKVFADGTTELVFGDAPILTAFEKWKKERTKKIEWDLG
jgi:hypothetical protein